MSDPQNPNENKETLVPQSLISIFNYPANTEIRPTPLELGQIEIHELKRKDDKHWYVVYIKGAAYQTYFKPPIMKPPTGRLIVLSYLLDSNGEADPGSGSSVAHGYDVGTVDENKYLSTEIFNSSGGSSTTLYLVCSFEDASVTTQTYEFGIMTPKSAIVPPNPQR